LNAWETIPLGLAVELVIDHRGKTPKKLGGAWAPAGVRVISAINIKGGRVDDENVRFITPDLYRRWMPVPLQVGDVLLTSEAPLGQVAFWASPVEAGLGQRLFALRAKSGQLDGRYLYYWLTSAEAQSQLHGRATGTTVGGIRQSELLKVRVPVPPIGEQRAIGAILGALDDKIESNRGVVGSAHALLRAFAESTDNMPLVPLSSLALASREMLDPNALERSQVEHFSIPAFDAGGVPEIASPSSIKSGKLAVRGSRILVSRLNPGTPRVWYAVPSSGLGLASTEFLVLDAPESSLAIVWLAVTAEPFLSAMKQRATGTSGSHQRVREADSLAIQVPDTRLAPSTVLDAADVLLRSVHQALAESTALSALRNALLPGLMSGTIPIPETRSPVVAV
jgi:type I restriction enzyme S subunit